MSDPAAQRTVEFESFDGPPLVGDLATPTIVRAGAVICHPHPQYGGNRFNNVVAALYEALPGVGVATLRFDFRAEFSDGVGEWMDALGAVEEIDATVGDLPIFMLGYSFGAWIAARVTDERVTASVLIAPPLAVMEPLAAPTVPTLVLTPEHDQFSPPSASAPIIAEWASESESPIDHLTIAMADHSLVGHAAAVATRSVTWLTGRL